MQDIARVGKASSHRRAKPLGVSGRGTQETLTSSVNFSAAWRLVRENDLIMLHGLQAGTALTAAILARAAGKATISVNHSLSPHMERQRRWWIRGLKQILLNMCSRHICQMPAARETLTEVYNIPVERITYAPFEGGASLYRPLTVDRDARRRTTRAKLGVGDDSVVFLFVGSMIPLKGPELLLRAVSEMSECAVHAVLAGPEEPGYGERGTLLYYRNLVGQLGLDDRVSILGRLDRDALADLYAAADIFVLPTYKDCLPKVFIEASLFGLPIITTVAPGSTGLMPIQGKSGYVVPIGDYKALAGAMRNLMNSDKRSEFSIVSLSVANECCDPDKEIAGFVEAIRTAQNSR